jgi:hypothetical protein
MATNFRNGIQFSKNGGDYGSLDARDKVTVSGRVMEIVLATALITSDNKFKFAAGGLRDFLGNLSASIETEEIDLDSAGPLLSKVTLAPDNKTITIVLNEETVIHATGTKKVKLSALVAAIQLSTNADALIPTYTPLSANHVAELNKNVLTIRLATALVGNHNKIKITAGILKDIFGNANEELITSTLIADQTGPTFQSTELPIKKVNRQLVITLNEKVSNGFTTGKPAENKIALKAALSISVNGGDYVALAGSDTIKISGNQILVNFANVLVKDQQYRIKIPAGALVDLTGNTCSEIVTDVFAVDTSGPALR